MPKKRPPDIIDRILVATAGSADQRGFHDRLSFEATIAGLSRLNQYQWDAATRELVAYAFFRAGLRVAEEMLRAGDNVFPEVAFRNELSIIRACGAVAKREADQAKVKKQHEH